MELTGAADGSALEGEEESLKVAKDFYDQYVHNPFRIK